MCDCVSGMVNSLLPVQVLTKVSDCVSGIGNSLLPVQVHTKVSECVIDIVNSLLPVQVHTKVLRDKKEDQTKTFLDSLVAATVSEKAALENMRSDKDLDGIFSRIGGVCWDTHTHTPHLCCEHSLCGCHCHCLLHSFIQLHFYQSSPNLK